LNDGEEGSSGFFHLTLLKPWENISENAGFEKTDDLMLGVKM